MPGSPLWEDTLIVVTCSVSIRLGGHHATITAPRSMGSLIRSTFADSLCPDDERVRSQIVIRNCDGRPEISVDGRNWDGGEVTDAIDQLVYVLMRLTLDAEGDRLHLHGGYVALDGCGILIAGEPGSGKSTLVAQLVDAGFDYLTDERIAVDATGAVTALTKPISIIGGSFGVLAHLDPARTGAGAASENLWHIPASQIRANSAVDHAQPHVLAFAAFRRNEPSSCVDMHPAEAVRRLLADSPSADRLGAAALERAAAFCSTVRCLHLRHDGSRQTVGWLRRALAADKGRPAEVSILELGTRASSAPEPHVLAPTPGLHGVVIADRSVLVREHTGEIFELDETATAWMQLLDGRTEVTHILEAVAEETGMSMDEVSRASMPVIEHLRSTGIVS